MISSASRPSRPSPPLGAAVLAIAIFAVPVKGADWASTQPVAMVLGGRVWHGGDATVQRILALSDRDGPGLLWRSGDPDEGLVDFWVLVTNGARAHRGRACACSPSPPIARSATRARGRGAMTTQLCEIVEQLPEVTVYSHDPELAMPDRRTVWNRGAARRSSGLSVHSRPGTWRATLGRPGTMAVARPQQRSALRAEVLEGAGSRGRARHARRPAPPATTAPHSP